MDFIWENTLLNKDGGGGDWNEEDIDETEMGEIDKIEDEIGKDIEDETETDEEDSY